MKIAGRLRRRGKGDTALKCFYPLRVVLLAGEGGREEGGGGACELKYTCLVEYSTESSREYSTKWNVENNVEVKEHQSTELVEEEWSTKYSMVA